jgi:hypothetical protein
MKGTSRYLIFAFFVALLAAGLAFGEFRSVLLNAINICLPCIGIG